jgi:hypothetical protein
MQSAIDITIPWRSWAYQKRLVLAVPIILCFAFPSWADLYHYRDSNGRLVISSTPPPADVNTVTIVPEGAGPSIATTAPSTAHKPEKNKKSKPIHRRGHSAQEQQLPAAARPVNTHRFGLLQLGSSQAEVKRILGPPAKRTQRGKERRLLRLHGRFVRRNVRVETWHYPGTQRVLPTQLTFYDGILAGKDKGGY